MMQMKERDRTNYLSYISPAAEFLVSDRVLAMPSPYEIHYPERLLSPSLVVFEEIVRANLEAAIAMVGERDRLRPHVKTHKMRAIVAMQEAMGLHKHKCATIAEAEMIAEAGGHDVLIAYPLVGPNLGRLARLVRAYPETTFRVLVDDFSMARALSEATRGLEWPVSTLVDLDVGMGRTGIAPGDEAARLYALVADLPGLEPDGLHAYDGHQKAGDLAGRREASDRGMRPALELRERLLARGFPVPRMILGGTPTFPVHATSTVPGSECSPGTCTLHDHGYESKYPDLPFRPAALLFTRVISRPRPGRITLDLGHKAVAADPVGARLVLPDLPDATLGGQSEEHLVVETPDATSYPPGTHFLAIPTHICPTVALHQRAYVVRGCEVVDEWEVSARNRTLRI
jgi:D-serine deaminase-like pyridoxal phosphate-dependent protein